MFTLDFILEWLGYLFAFIGLLATIYKAIEKWINIHRLSWKDIDRYAKRIAKEIIKEKYNPDIIFTVGRGGAIFGSLLSGCLHNSKIPNKNTPIFGTDRVYEWEGNQRVGIKNTLINIKLLKNKKVLVVAGDIMSGGTMQFVTDQLEDIKVKDIKIACIVKSKASTVIPNYLGKEITSDFKMPWMYKSFKYVRDSRTPS